MPRTPSATDTSAEIIRLPTATSKPVRFSASDRQALLTLTYAVPGTGVDMTAYGSGDVCAVLGAHDFEDGAWWTICRVRTGFDVLNVRGYRVGRFATMQDLVTALRPSLAYIARLTARDADVESLSVS